MSAILAITLIALALIGVTGAALLTGHASFDQFLGVAGGSGLVGSVLHVLSAGKSSTGSA